MGFRFRVSGVRVQKTDDRGQMSRLSSWIYNVAAAAFVVLVPYKILISEYEYEKNQIRSLAYALRRFLFSEFRIPDTRNLTPETYNIVLMA
jgi:hypothetical protein